MQSAYQAIRSLDGVHQTFEVGGQRFLIFFKTCLEQRGSTVKESMKARVFDGTFLWVIEFNHQVLASMRARSSVEGSDHDICEMIKMSLLDADFMIELVEYNLLVTFQFKVGRGISLKSQLDFGEALLVSSDEEYRQVHSLMVFDLYDVMKTEKSPFIHRPIIDNSHLLQQRNSVYEQIQQLSIDDTRGVKQKVTDIVIPSMKKRKGLGAKIG